MLFHAHEFGPEGPNAYRQATTLAPDDYRWHYLGRLLLAETDLEAARVAYGNACDIENAPARWSLFATGMLSWSWGTRPTPEPPTKRLSNGTPTPGSRRWELPGSWSLTDKLQEAREKLDARWNGTLPSARPTSLSQIALRLGRRGLRAPRLGRSQPSWIAAPQTTRT